MTSTIDYYLMDYQARQQLKMERHKLYDLERTNGIKKAVICNSCGWFGELTLKRSVNKVYVNGKGSCPKCGLKLKIRIRKCSEEYL